MKLGGVWGIELSQKSGARRSAVAPEPIEGASDTPHERFKRLAQKRVIRAIKDLRLIGNLGNRSNYQYTADEVEKIFRTLEKELRASRAMFHSSRRDGSLVDFSL